MKRKIRLLLSLVTVLSVMCCLSLSVFAVEPRYSITDRITLSLSYTSSGAKCYARITGTNGTTGISNCTVTLTDSNGNEVKTWKDLSATGTTLLFSKTATNVTQGETYTLSITADVSKDDLTETVSDSITRKYN